ncbi:MULTISPECIES: DUF2812 domain-containing protein [Neobacillus]|jgi:hypothetical protein|uniref:DUF2812 domain-containing protein n=1 Tax=Neobacillus sedimentimangrovi TaxID=2699460 RepID=A0ABS8QIH4_9BACI|nr:DUF2812 domain-containing protein [Neobacillus sedimentimangrovi]MCD4839063.1 DUF2812 domain-containing protein [Neobacillus sedimentimangrovi]
MLRKFKFFIDFDKEEKWLNEMAKKGYQFLHKSIFGYTFQESEPENTIIKIDFRRFKNQADFIDYITLFEDSGWKHVSGSKGSGAQYFKKIDPNAHDDIFSDQLSKAGKYKRLSEMFIELGLCYVPIFAALVATDAIDIAALFHPKQLYLTKGLWDMTGGEFWKAFLFETPFVIFRTLSWLFIPIMILLYFIFGYKAQMLFEKHKNQ